MSRMGLPVAQGLVWILILTYDSTDSMVDEKTCGDLRIRSTLSRFQTDTDKPLDARIKLDGA